MRHLGALIASLACGTLFNSSALWPIQASTSTALTLTAAGAPVSSITRATALTLTARVTSGDAPVSPGQVDFCDASVSYCTDIHLFGTAQLTKAGIAQLKYVPGIGVRNYRAVFKGTNSFASSASDVVSIAVAGRNPVEITVDQVENNTTNFALTAHVWGMGTEAPTGTMTFVDRSFSQDALGLASVVADQSGLSFPRGPISIAEPAQILADVTGDGIPDEIQLSTLLGADASSHVSYISISPGDGHGYFGNDGPPLFDTGHLLTLVASVTVDLDADGIPDILGTDDSGNLLSFLGKGDGSFQPGGSSSLGARFQLGVLADFNRDGIADLALITASNEIAIVIGDGNGTFLPSTGVRVQAGDHPVAMICADFNADGIEDLAISNSTPDTGSVRVLLGRGDASFRALPDLQVNAPSIINVADVNGDGLSDLISASSGGSPLLAWLGNGDGTFQPPISNSLPWPDALPFSWIQFGDFNADGIADLTVTSKFDSLYESWEYVLLKYAVLLGNGEGAFNSIASGSFMGTPGGIFSFPATHTFAGPPQRLDLNGDGASDIHDGEVDYNSDNPVAKLAANQTAKASVDVSLTPNSGLHTLCAIYSGDNAYEPSSYPACISVVMIHPKSAPILTLRAFPNPAPYGSHVSICLSIAGDSDGAQVPTGGVYFRDETGELPPLPQPVPPDPPPPIRLVDGYACVGATYVVPGPHQISASYTGDDNYLSGTAVSTLIVNKPIPIASLTSTGNFIPHGSAVTFTLTLTGTGPMPTGSISFVDGSTTLAQAHLDSKGAATYTASSLANGTHSIMAFYAGDANYGPVDSSPLQIVTSSDPFYNVTGTALAVRAGATSANTSTISITPTQGFVGTVSLSAVVTSSPAGAQFPPALSFGSVNSVKITGTSPATAVLSISTTAPTRAANSIPQRDVPVNQGSVAVLACLILIAPIVRVRKHREFFAVLLLFVAASGVFACGGGGNKPGGSSGTTPGSYTITITATSGPITQHGTVTLRVQ
jgi:hypothetical protein